VAQQVLEEKYEAVKALIVLGKERGYLLYDEVNDSLPAEVHSSEEIDDFTHDVERNGMRSTKTRRRRKRRARWSFRWKAPSATRTQRTTRTPMKAAATWI